MSRQQHSRVCVLRSFKSILNQDNTTRIVFLVAAYSHLFPPVLQFLTELCYEHTQMHHTHPPLRKGEVETVQE